MESSVLSTYFYHYAQRGYKLTIILLLTDLYQRFKKIYSFRILKKLSMYQIGRNFYKPSETLEIPQHK